MSFNEKQFKEVLELFCDFNHMMGSLTSAITPRDALPYVAENGTRIGSLTEAMIGVKDGLSEIATSISYLADIIDEKEV